MSLASQDVVTGANLLNQTMIEQGVDLLRANEGAFLISKQTTIFHIALLSVFHHCPLLDCSNGQHNSGVSAGSRGQDQERPEFRVLHEQSRDYRTRLPIIDSVC